MDDTHQLRCVVRRPPKSGKKCGKKTIKSTLVLQQGLNDPPCTGPKKNTTYMPAHGWQPWRRPAPTVPPPSFYREKRSTKYASILIFGAQLSSQQSSPPSPSPPPPPPRSSASFLEAERKLKARASFQKISRPAHYTGVFAQTQWSRWLPVGHLAREARTEHAAILWFHAHENERRTTDGERVHRSGRKPRRGSMLNAPTPKKVGLTEARTINMWT